MFLKQNNLFWLVTLGCILALAECQSSDGCKNIPFSSSDRLSLDRLNGQQFIELVDPLMEGQLSRIIDQIKQNSDLNKFPKACQLSARSYINLLDNLTSNKFSALLHSVFPSFFSRLSMNFDRSRRASLDSMTGLSLGSSKRGSLDPLSGVSFGAPNKRSSNFDEMDRAGFSGFVKRSSDFDEIDRSGFSGFAKRRNDFDEIDRAGFSGFVKRRNDFDEIDRAGFSGFVKRQNNWLFPKRGIDFDEIDRAGFSGFVKRHNFDELDHSGFSGFVSKKATSPLATLVKAAEEEKSKSAKSS